MEIKEYFNPLLKWWWLILLSAVIAGGASYMATRQQAPEFASQATLIIGSTIDNPNPSNSELSLSQQLAATYVDLANRNSVRETTMEALGLDWLPEIRVFQPTNSNTIEIIVTDTDPVRAQAVAAELSRQLILRSPTAQDDRSARQDFVNEQLDEYEQAITETKDQINAKKEELGQLVSAREISSVQSEIRSLESKLQTLQSIYANLLQGTGEGATNTVRILEEASLPRRPINSNNMMTILTAAAVGFALAATAAYVLEYLDNSVKTPAQIERLVQQPTLAGIGFIKPTAEHESLLVTINQPKSAMSEAYRVLRTGIQFSGMDGKNSILLITSAVPQEGKSTTAANLSVVLAQAGYRVLLLDADLRRPSQHRVFDLPNSRGLTTILLQMDDAEESETLNLIEDAAHPAQVDGLQVITCGPLPPNPSELLGSVRMNHLLEVAEEAFDYVVIDSPPVLSVTDSVILAAQAGSTIVVVQANKSREDDLTQTIERLHDVNANVVGCVLNLLKPRSEGFQYYHYFRDPYYTPDEPDEPDVSGNALPKRKLLKRFRHSHETA